MLEVVKNVDWHKNEKLGPTHLEYDACLNTLVYTKNLLEVFGIKAFYTLINVSEKPINVIEKLPSLQGNQMILFIPLPNDELWLDCASYEWPFNFISKNKTQRTAFVITEDGGKIEHTPTYTADENLQKTDIQLKLNKNGEILEGSLRRSSKNIAFEKRSVLYNKDLLEEDFIRQFSKLKDFKINNLSVSASPNEAKKYEEFNFIGKLIENSKNIIKFSLSTFGTPFSAPKNDNNRVAPFTITKGFSYEDEIELELPNQTKIEIPFQKINKQNKFGTYEVEVLNQAKKLKIKRKYTLKSGEFKKADYALFVKFIESILEDEESVFIVDSQN